MKKLLTLSIVILLAALLALPAVAADNGSQPTPQPPSPSQTAAQEKPAPTVESEGRQLQRSYYQRREAAKKHRDEMLKVREQAVQSGQ